MRSLLRISRPAARAVSGLLAVVLLGLQMPAVASAQPAGGPGKVVARFENATVDRERLVDFLIQTRGLDALLNLMQLELARALAAEEGITVTQEMIDAEARRTLDRAFAEVTDVTEEEYPELLEQLLAKQQLSRAEFDVVMETNAHLRAITAPRIAEQIDDDVLRQAFNLRFGEQVRVQHIAAGNLAEVAEARDRLEAGEDFSRVARDLSREPTTGEVGGELPPFSMQSQALPEVFKQTAFALEEGEISDPVETGGFYHLIKLIERIEPRAVKFEDVKDDLREQLAQEQAQTAMTLVRQQISQALAGEQLEIADPRLAEQLQNRLEAARPQPTDPEALKKQMESQRPAVAPATTPTTQPTNRP